MSAYKNTVLIYNPRAGKFERSRGSLLDQLTEALRREGHNVTVAPTTGPGTAGAIAREHIARGADLIVAAGGDGTINEIAEGMVHSQVPLAILPAGTANVLAVETGLGKLQRAAARLDQLRPRRISIGRLTCDGGRVSRHFLLMAGIGLDAKIVYRVNAGLKARTGKFAYWVASWSLLGRNLPEFNVEVDGRRRQRCSFALVSKVKNYGGDFSIARSVDLLQDRFEVVLFEGRSTFRYARYFLGLVLNRLNGMRGLTVTRAGEVKLDCPDDSRVYVQIDGEYAGRLPAEIRIVPDALTVLLDEKYGSAS